MVPSKEKIYELSLISRRCERKRKRKRKRKKEERGKGRKVG